MYVKRASNEASKQTYNSKHRPSSIYSTLSVRFIGKLEPIHTDFRRKARYTLGWLPITGLTQKQTAGYSHSLPNLWPIYSSQLTKSARALGGFHSMNHMVKKVKDFAFFVESYMKCNVRVLSTEF